METLARSLSFDTLFHQSSETLRVENSLSTARSLMDVSQSGANSNGLLKQRKISLMPPLEASRFLLAGGRDDGEKEARPEDSIPQAVVEPSLAVTQDHVFKKLEANLNTFCRRYFSRLIESVGYGNYNQRKDRLYQCYQFKEEYFARSIDNAESLMGSVKTDALHRKNDYFFEYVQSNEIDSVVEIAHSWIQKTISSLRSAVTRMSSLYFGVIVKDACDKCLDEINEALRVNDWSRDYVNVFGGLIVECIQHQLILYKVYKKAFYDDLKDAIDHLPSQESLKLFDQLIFVFIEDAFNRAFALSDGHPWYGRLDVFYNQPGVIEFYYFKEDLVSRLNTICSLSDLTDDSWRVVDAVRGFLTLVDNDYLRDLGDIRELADLCQSFNEVVLENNQVVVDQAERLKAEYLESVSEKYCLDTGERYALEKVVTFACNCHLEFSIDVTSMPASFNQRYRYQIMVNEYLEYNSEAVKNLLEKTALEAKQQGENIEARRKDSTFHMHPVSETTSEVSSMAHIGHWEGPPQEDIDIDEQLLVTIKNACQDIPVIEIAGATIRGAKKRQKGLHSEDRFFYHDLSFTAGKECLWGIITGVIDGHGGGNAEDFVVEHFAPCLKKALEKRCKKGLNQTAIVNSLTIAMVSMNFKYSGQGGATISIILKIGEVIYTANVGDSVTVLLYYNGDVVQLSADELLFSDITCQRITDYGGEVINRPDPDDPLDRLTMIVTDSLQCEQSRNIMLSNVFGDHLCCGVLTGRPAITATKIGQWREAGIMGWLHFTDGVTEAASASDAGRWVIHKLQEKEAVRDAVTSLVRQCSVAGSRDDITAVLCTLG